MSARQRSYRLVSGAIKENKDYAGCWEDLNDAGLQTESPETAPQDALGICCSGSRRHLPWFPCPGTMLGCCFISPPRSRPDVCVWRGQEGTSPLRGVRQGRPENMRGAGASFCPFCGRGLPRRNISASFAFHSRELSKPHSAPSGGFRQTLSTDIQAWFKDQPTLRHSKNTLLAGEMLKCYHAKRTKLLYLLAYNCFPHIMGFIFSKFDGLL